MSKKYDEIQEEPLMAAEPVATYGLQPNAKVLTGMPISSANPAEPFRNDEHGRIMLTENMREAVRKAEQSLTDGTCLNEEMFQTRFAKWL